MFLGPEVTKCHIKEQILIFTVHTYCQNTQCVPRHTKIGAA